MGVLWSSHFVILFAAQERPAVSPLVLAALRMTSAAKLSLNSQARSGKQCSD